jgi:hypothetical protein
MTIFDEIPVDITGVIIAHKVWEKLKITKLKITYENTTPVNEVHLMRKLVNMRIEESKGAIEHLWLFTGTLSQLQDSGQPAFDNNLKAIYLFMTLPSFWA